MTEWIKREFSKGEIDRCGSSLIPWWSRSGPKPDDLWRGYTIIQNWRSSHALPLLTFRMGLSQRARRIEPKAIIAQRLKRFSSVMNKLAREPMMKLSQMQDLGGCRAILKSIDSVYRVASLYRAPVSDSESSLKYYDYIKSPKADGYRGIHIVGRYHARVEKNEPWNGHRIEIQLRSQLQHAFATAVETATTFTRSRAFLI
jgi:(p)ppGpp synthase/HD superfamily hydrolase